MAEQRIFGRYHQVGIAGLIEVPPVAVAFCLDDTDLLELLQTAAAAPSFRVVLAEAMNIAERVLLRILHVRIIDLEFMQQRDVGALRVGLVLLVKITAGAEVLAGTADDENFHIIVDVGAVDEVSKE